MKPGLHFTTLLTVALLPVLAPGASSQSGAGTQAPRLYVANQADVTVSVIDTKRNEVIATVDLKPLGFGPGAKAHDTAVDPDGQHWYVSLIAGGKVLRFDRDNRLVGSAPFETPGLLRVDPTRDLLFVGRSMAAVNPPQRIGIIDRNSMAIDELDVFFPRPHALAVTPDGHHLFSGSLAGNDLASIDVTSDQVELSHLPGDPNVFVQFAVSPDGHTLIATGQLTGTLLVFDLADPDHPHLTHTVSVNAAPWHPAFSPDGRFVYFGNQGANTVTVVETAHWSVTRVISGPGLAEPHGIAVSPDGHHVYVSNRNLKGEYHPDGGPPDARPGTVVVINTDTFEIEKVIEVGHYAAGMAIGD